MPDPTQASGLFWATAFGAALGVVAGTLIQYLIDALERSQSRKRQKSALLKELAYNRPLVDELAEEAQKLRNAVNGNVLNTYFGYFGYSKAIFAQANASTMNGVLYELFSIEQIRHAQRLVSLLSAANEKWVNEEVARRRNALINNPATFDRGDAVRFVDFIDLQTRDLSGWIDDLMGTLR